jgi:hypothetical protein
MEPPQGPFCQSCAMPMARDEDLGTEKDGSKSTDYCCYCYKDGEFVDPDITLEEMIEFCSKKMEELGVMSYDRAKKLNERYLPTLKRWRK